MNKTPRVGVGVLLFNEKEELLLGKRVCDHGARTWGPPGGHLEFGETLENCAVREVLEETGMRIDDPVFCALTNSIFEEEGAHYVSLFMKVLLEDDQIPRVCEPDKTQEWRWFSQDNLPSSLFMPLQQLLDRFGYGGLPW